MKNSANFAFFLTKKNNNLMKESSNNFKSKNQKKQSNFYKDSHLNIARILITQINW